MCILRIVCKLAVMPPLHHASCVCRFHMTQLTCWHTAAKQHSGNVQVMVDLQLSACSANSRGRAQNEGLLKMILTEALIACMTVTKRAQPGMTTFISAGDY